MKSGKTYEIAVLPGDGIGMEVMSCAEQILSVISSKNGIELHLNYQKAGAQHYLETGDALPEDVLGVCEKSDAILFGAMGLPNVRKADGTEIIPQLDLRFHFDLYAGIRPIRCYPGIPSPLKSQRASEIDMVLVRENTEGLFFARGRAEVVSANGIETEVLDTMKITRKGTERVCRYAFEIAKKRAEQKNRKAKVTSIDKANVFSSMAFWRTVFNGVSKQYPDVLHESAYVDAMALNLLKRPWDFDVMVTENMFGDILSDLIAGLVGGMGMAPSADIGDKYALFQPAHGTAPDIMGQGKANPVAMLLSAAMMLDWLGEKYAETRCLDAAVMIDQAVANVFRKGSALPVELGGKDGLKAVTQAVLKEIMSL